MITTTKSIRAVVVHVNLTKSALSEQDFMEFHSLVTSIGAIVVAEINCRHEFPDSKYFIGQGKGA